MMIIFLSLFFGMKIFFLLAVYSFSMLTLSRSIERWELIGMIIESNYSLDLSMKVFRITDFEVPYGPNTLKFLFSSGSYFRENVNCSRMK